MKRILFMLALVTVVASCKKDGVDIREADILGTWVHVETLKPSGEKDINQPFTLEITDDHELTMYAGGNYETYTWKIDGKKIVSKDKTEGNDFAAIIKADGKHLVYSVKADDGTYQFTWINIEKILPGEWTVQWQDAAQYATLNADGSSVWKDATTGQSAGTYSWELHIDIEKSRAVIQYKGDKWNDMEPIYAATDNAIWVTNKSSGPGKYTRGKIESPGFLTLDL